MKFSLDLMHLAFSEYEELKDAEGLMNHLKECKKCRAQVSKIKEVGVFTFLASPRSAKYQAGMKKILKRATCLSSRDTGNKDKKNNGCK